MHPILALTPKEKQAIALVREGLSNRQIAEIMKVSHRTIATHLYNASYKINAKNRIELLLILDGKLKAETEIVPSRANAYKLSQIKIRELNKQGLDALQIAERLGIGAKAVRENLVKMGIPKRKYKRKSKQ
jgi:DNA-binding CsgD family transcriptional regulator